MIEKSKEEIIEFVIDWLNQKEMKDGNTKFTDMWEVIDSLDTLELIFDIEEWMDINPGTVDNQTIAEMSKEFKTVEEFSEKVYEIMCTLLPK